MAKGIIQDTVVPAAEGGDAKPPGSAQVANPAVPATETKPDTVAQPATKAKPAPKPMVKKPEDGTATPIKVRGNF